MKKVLLIVLCAIILQSCDWLDKYKEPASWSLETVLMTSEHRIGIPSFWTVILRGIPKSQVKERWTLSYTSRYSGCSVFWGGSHEALEYLHSSNQNPLQGSGRLDKFMAEDRFKNAKKYPIYPVFSQEREECSFLIFFAPGGYEQQDFTIVVTNEDRKERHSLLIPVYVKEEKGFVVK